MNYQIHSRKIKEAASPPALQYYAHVGVSREPEHHRVLFRQFASNKSEQELREKIDHMIETDSLPPKRYAITWVRYGQILFPDAPGSTMEDLSEACGTSELQQTDAALAAQIMTRLQQGSLTDGRKAAVLRMLHRIEADAIRNNLITQAPFAGMRLKPQAKKPGEILSRKECHTIHSQDPADPLNAYLQLALYTAARPGENLGIAADDLDEDRRKLHICRQIRPSRAMRGKGDYEIIPLTKTLRRREIMLPSKAIEIIQTRQEQVQQDRAKAGAGWHLPADPALQLLLVDARGLPVTFTGLRKRLREILAREDVDLRVLRRTALSNLYRATGSMKAVMLQSGETSRRCLLEHYLVATEEERQEMATRDDACFRALLGPSEQRYSGANPAGWIAGQDALFLERHVLPEIGDIGIGDLSAQDVRRLQITLLQKHQNIWYANQAKYLVRRLFAYA